MLLEEHFPVGYGMIWPFRGGTTADLEISTWEPLKIAMGDTHRRLPIVVLTS
jgi:hypothetical protein